MSVFLVDNLSRVAAVTLERGDPLSVRSTASLVREFVRTGDDDLFHNLVRRYRDRVFRLAVSVLGPGNESEAEDVAQEVFVLVYRKIDNFRHESDFSTWLFRMTKNHALDRRRLARMRHPHVGDQALSSIPAPGRSNDPEMAAVDRERRARILELIERLPDQQRTAIYLHYWMGSGVAEIAELMEMKLQTVKSHLYRARRRLFRELNEDGACHA